GVALEHHADVARVRRHEPSLARQDAAVEADDAALGTLQSREAPERRGLAAAGRTEQRVEAPVLHGERDVLDRVDAATVGRVRLAEPFDLEHQVACTVRPPRRWRTATRATRTTIIITESAAIAVYWPVSRMSKMRIASTTLCVEKRMIPAESSRIYSEMTQYHAGRSLCRILGE